jgi:glycosyltransferase involved in cell wall biosynthesis
MSPKVSIVLCTYNQAAFLRDAVASALGQTHANLELIVVDNGSTDGSPAILEEYRGDPRVRLMLHPTNEPVTKRLNEAIAVSSGDYISLLYGDDYYLPEKLERQLQAFAGLTPDYGVVYSPNYRIDDETGNKWIDKTLKCSGAILKEMFVRHDEEGFINPISPLLRRECFLRCRYQEDVFMEGESILLRIAVTYKFHYLDQPLTVMREHANNVGKAIKLNAESAMVLIGRLPQEPGFPPELLGDLNAFLGRLFGVWGWLGIRMAADPSWARRCFLSAIRRQPQQLLRPRTIGGLALSMLPASGVRLFNRAMNALRDHKENVVFRPDYN